MVFNWETVLGKQFFKVYKNDGHLEDLKKFRIKSFWSLIIWHPDGKFKERSIKINNSRLYCASKKKNITFSF